jgi:hypothetical protein
VSVIAYAFVFLVPHAELSLSIGILTDIRGTSQIRYDGDDVVDALVLGRLLSYFLCET